MDTKLHPLAVEFGEIECCAMEVAGTRESHEPFIDEYLLSVCTKGAKYDVYALLSVFQHTVRLIFIPADVHRNLYTQLAVMEKAVLESSEEERLSCGHTRQEHLKALDAIWDKMQV